MSRIVRLIFYNMFQTNRTIPAKEKLTVVIIALFTIAIIISFLVR